VLALQAVPSQAPPPTTECVVPPISAEMAVRLVKVDQLHTLARDVYYGRRGRINAHELHEQMNSCSCLTLILTCIIYWQARATVY
jgi:Tn3 transposase DDE domain